MAQIDRPCGTGEHHGTGLQVLLRRARKVGWIEWTLGDGEVAGIADELLELSVCELTRPHPEAVDSDLVDRTLLRIVAARPHRVRLSWNPREIGGHAPPMKMVF